MTEDKDAQIASLQSTLFTTQRDLASCLEASKAIQAREWKLKDALKSAEAWLSSWAQHVGNCRGGDRCTCGLEAIRNEARIALAPPDNANTPTNQLRTGDTPSQGSEQK